MYFWLDSCTSPPQLDWEHQMPAMMQTDPKKKQTHCASFDPQAGGLDSLTASLGEEVPVEHVLTEEKRSHRPLAAPESNKLTEN